MTSNHAFNRFVSTFQQNKAWFIGACLLASALLAVSKFHIPLVNSNQPEIKLEQPDVWVHSQNFALLPHDLLKVPLLKSILTEDFVYFYEQDEDWLSLQGAMRRISFDHDLNWSDKLLKNIADAPVDLYMWHDDSHAPSYWALSMERDQLTVIAQELATLKLAADKQLHQIARIDIGGDDVPVLRVTLSPRRQMVFAAHNKRIALLSDVAMAGHEEGALDTSAQLLIKRLLSDDAATRAQVVSTEWHTTNTAESKQTILVSNRLFAQGYEDFTSSVRVLRFDFNGKSWLTQANLNPTDFDSDIWKHLPANAAFCAAMPVDWSQVQKTLDGATIDTKPTLAEEFFSTTAVCWYTEEGDDITQPLFVALRQPGKNSTESLSALFDWGVATNKDYLKDIYALNRQKYSLRQQLEYAEANLANLKKETINPKLTKEQQVNAKAQLEARKTSAKVGIKVIEKELDAIEPKIKVAREAAKAPAIIAHEKSVEHEGAFTIISRKLAIDSKLNNSPKLAFDEHVVYFSTNQELIARAVSVGQKHYPNLMESTKVLGRESQQFLYVNPKKLALLLDNTAHEALPQESKPRLRAAFDYHMPARLQALAKQPVFSLELDHANAETNKPKAGDAKDDGYQWQPLTWYTAP